MKTAVLTPSLPRLALDLALVVMATTGVGSMGNHVMAETVGTPSSVRAQTLVRMVRQDCGSCHGMRLTGGLGPALTPQALREMPIDSVAATIYHGRPGTPMPPWKAMISESEARWMAEHLLAGFPTENTR
jgi:cytochrome c55X